MKKNIFKGKVASIIVIALMLVTILSNFTSADAVKIGDAYKPGMTINFAGIENPKPFVVNGKTYPAAVNVNGINYFGGRVLEEAGGSATYENGVATYSLPNMGNTDACSQASRAVVYLFKNGQQVGNGFFFETGNGTELLVSSNAWNQSHIIKDYKGDIIPIGGVPIKMTERLVWLKTNGYKSPYTLPISKIEPKSGDTSNLITSIDGVPNLVNYSKVKDYFDFNVFTTGDKRYLRTYNNSVQNCQGSPGVNENCEVIGVYIYKGANYSLFVDLDDIRGFLNLDN